MRDRRAPDTAYYAAHFGKSLLWTASDQITLYTLVALYHIDASLAGWLFLGGLTANALADLAVGAWLDRDPGVAPLLAMAGLGIAAFAFPLTMLGASHGSAAVMAAMLIFRVAYAAYDVPHNAMLSQLGDTPQRASRLSRGRTLGSGGAATLVALGLRAPTGVNGVAILLWTIAIGAALLGGALLPLLRRARPNDPDGPITGGRKPGWGLPWPFLLGSMTGIVALGALAKAILHLHLPGSGTAPGAGTMLLMLTLGRTGAALLPLRFDGPRGGMRLLALAHSVAAMLVLSFAWTTHPLLMVALGMMMGTTNQIEWALLPSISGGVRSYGLFTMTSKLALGSAGLAMTLALGAAPTFTGESWRSLLVGIMIACGVAALLLMPRNSWARASGDLLKT